MKVHGQMEKRRQREKSLRHLADLSSRGSAFLFLRVTILLALVLCITVTGASKVYGEGIAEALKIRLEEMKRRIKEQERKSNQASSRSVTGALTGALESGTATPSSSGALGALKGAMKRGITTPSSRTIGTFTGATTSSSKRSAIGATQDNLRKTQDSLRKTQDSLRKTQDSLRRTQDSLRRTQDRLRLRGAGIP